MHEIPLTRGQVAIVDDEDYEWLSRHKWNANPWKTKTFYAVSAVRGVRVSMHRLILNPPPGFQVDHVNGNGLDNRRHNLRVATPADNQHNSGARGGTSRFKGVKTTPWGWVAYIRVPGRITYLGTFQIEEDAARAYDQAAIRLHGDFARLNFPESAMRARLSVGLPANAKGGVR